MSFSAFTYDQIEAYLNGEMSSLEQAAFEKELSTNNNLAEQLEKHKLANALIIENRLLSVKNILAEERVKTVKQTLYKKYVYAALALVAAIGTTVAVLVYANNKKADPSPKQSEEQRTQEGGIFSEKEKINSMLPAISEKSYQTKTPEPTYLRKQDVQLIEEQHQLNKEYNTAKVSPDTVKALDAAHPGKSVETCETTDVCAGIAIKADVGTTATCLHEAAGNILVHNIQGGVKPYVVSIIDTHKEAVRNGELVKGIYQVYITDKNGCQKIYPAIEITEKDCPKDYSFNPFVGETWIIEPHSTSGKIEIYNKGGVLYYQANLEAHASNEWTGTGLNNQILPGYYIFVIKYTDGTSKKGSVTIVQ